MNKSKTRNKIQDRGTFYDSKKCFICGKLIWGSSPKNHRLASKDCYLKIKAHQEEHEKEKEGQQLNLAMSNTPGKKAEPVSRVTLRGEVKKRKSG